LDLIAVLRTFVRVAEIGSFSAVAEEQGVTQPAVSRQVTALEEHFGTRLLQRSTHAVTLTEEGRDLLPAVQQLLDSADTLEESTGQRRSKPVGLVRLAVPHSFGLYLSSQLGGLLNKHEALSIDLVVQDHFLDIIEEGLDLQVIVGPANNSALISRRIGRAMGFLVAAPQYLSGRSLPEQPSDLQYHDCIVYHRWGPRNVWWFSSPEGNVSVSVRGRFRTNNADAVRRATLDGRGIALLSHFLVAEDIQAGRLRSLMPAFPPLRLPLSVVYPSRRNLPPRVRTVIEFLTELLRADPEMTGEGQLPIESDAPTRGRNDGTL